MSQNPDHLSKLLLEADGLLLLLHRHRDETPIDAIKLLRRKLELILTLTEGLDEEFDDEPIANSNQINEVRPQSQPEENDDATTEESAPDNEPEETTSDYIEDTIESAPEETHVNVGEDVVDDTTSASQTVCTPELQSTDEVEVVEYDPNYEFVEMTAETVVSDIEPQAPIFIDRDDEPSVIWDDEPEEKTTDINKDSDPVPYRRTYVITDSQVDRNHQASNNVFQDPTPARRPVSSVFNLNDKFRFRRELFGNSDAQYVECLDLLSAMSSLDEAKDYLFEDLNWNPENEDVKAFVELLTNYYK